MTTRVGVGQSADADSWTAGQMAARNAMQSASLERIDLALVFATAKHRPAPLRDAIRDVIGPEPRIVGGNAVGIITNDSLGYDGTEVGVALFSSDSVHFQTSIAGDLAGNEEDTGERLGRQLDLTALSSDSSLLLFYDTVNLTEEQVRLNMATPLIEGLSRHVDHWPNMAGMGLLGDMQLQPTWQLFDDLVEQQSAIAVQINGDLRMDTAIMHGCRPAGDYHTITRTDGPVVLEIDDRPALDVIGELLGTDSTIGWDDYAFFVTLGVNKGDRFGAFREEDYANRMCIGVDEERRGLIMFENDLRPGSEVQLMRRSLDVNYVGRRTRDMLSTLGSRRPVFAFYIDCAGRAGAYCGLDEEDAAEVQQALPADVPLLGVYSGVEIARVAGDVQALDWTGVLCLFSEPCSSA